MPESDPGDRRTLLQQLDTYQRQYPAEWVMAARMRDFVYHHARCFHRDLPVGHVTGSAWLLDQSGERVLLTHHRKLDKWLQLGGHADGEPDVSKVALKEAREESGIRGIELLSPDIFDLDIHLIPARKEEPSHYHYDCRFLMQCTESEDFTVSDESHDLMWIPLQELDSRTREISIQRMATKTPRSLILCS